MGDNEVYQIYQAEFDQAYEEHTLFLLTMHPFVSGHRSRLAAVDRLLGYIGSKQNVWFATLQQVAAESKAQLAASP
jgi:hypothetical protein